MKTPFVFIGMVGLAVVSLGADAIISHPASSTAPETVRIEPTAKIPDTTTTTTTAPSADESVERAEKAAGRAETAAARAEVAATRAEVVVTSSTTLTSTTTAPSPALAVTADPVAVIETTTTTTTAPKAWVEVARFASPWDGTVRLVDATIETGQLRVWTVAPNGYRVPGVDGQVWMETTDGAATILAGRYDDGTDESLNGPWPVGQRRLGTNVTGDSIRSGVIVVEEYR